MSDDIVAALRALINSQGLRRQAEEGCRAWLSSAADDVGIGGWSAEEIEPHFDRFALVFDHGILSYPFLETKYGLYVRDTSGVFYRDLIPVGHYRLITLLDGTIDDDYFVIDREKT